LTAKVENCLAVHHCDVDALAVVYVAAVQDRPPFARASLHKCCAYWLAIAREIDSRERLFGLRPIDAHHVPKLPPALWGVAAFGWPSGRHRRPPDVRPSITSAASSSARAERRRSVGTELGFTVRPSSTSRRIVSDRPSRSSCLAAQASTLAMNSLEKRNVRVGSRPVAGRPVPGRFLPQS
jgi:hypothetical protein